MIFTGNDYAPPDDDLTDEEREDLYEAEMEARFEAARDEKNED